MNSRTVIIIFLLCACCTLPVSGATKYIMSSPDLTAFIAGSNDFSPGQETTVTITVQNKGLNIFKFVDSGTMERDDLPNTAKLTTVQLLPGTAPVVVKTDPQNIGDIPGGGMADASVTIRIANSAPAGGYELPLLVRYKYMEQSLQDYGSDNIQFIYGQVERTIPLTIRIRPNVRISVVSSTADSLNVGTEGYLRLTIRNDGTDNGKKATVILTRSGSSPVIPTDSSVFMGDFPSGGVINATCKLAISNKAEAQMYPVDVSVTYEDHEGSVVTSDPVTVGIPVGGKAGFIITSQPQVIPAGQKGVISVDYQNAGTIPVYHAQTRISMVPPFSSADDTAYLGTLNPGETATARFGISVIAGAEPKDYTLNSEVRYRDALDNSQISDTIKVTIRIPPETGSASPLLNPLVLSAAAACIIGAGYYLFVMRKKR